MGLSQDRPASLLSGRGGTYLEKSFQSSRDLVFHLLVEALYVGTSRGHFSSESFDFTGEFSPPWIDFGVNGLSDHGNYE